MARITTKNGDGGVTQLNPDRIASKAHPIIEIMGTIDEINCALGVDGSAYDEIQTFLSEIMGYMYFKQLDERKIAAQIWQMEEYIESHNNSIPPYFVNPRGYVSMARAICRRAERMIVGFVEDERALPESERYGMNMYPVIGYFNRLSDYLFVRSFEREQTQPELFNDELAIRAVG